VSILSFRSITLWMMLAALRTALVVSPRFTRAASPQFQFASSSTTEG
jgi:hypothetical protein